MRVRLLGTGSADGWPNAFCTCAACTSALDRCELRAPTSALVDGRLLLDCGPETPRSALRCGESLAAVTHVLITHDHPDHSAPMALLSRRWAAGRLPLTVIAPEPVVEAWRRWAAPDDDVRFVVVAAGTELDAGGYRVQVLGARHQVRGPGDAVLYDVAAPGGARLLYATDTGPLTARTHEAVVDAGYDLVLIDATFGDRAGPGRPSRRQHRDHLDLGDLAGELAALRASAAVHDGTDVVAVHLSHHGPPGLGDRLERLGARTVPDGTELVVRRGHDTSTVADGPGRDGQRTHHRATGQGGAPRAHRTLVIGGVRSGKSVVAERLLARHGPVTYVATGPATSASDPEWAGRVRQHRARRPTHWSTIETTELAATLRAACEPVLVDCLGTWLTAVLDRVGAWGAEPDEPEPAWRDQWTAVLDDLVEAWHAVSVPVVAVTNEVGAGVVPAMASGRLFRDELGRLNTRLSLASERVLLVVAGRTVDLSDPAGPGVRPTRPDVVTGTGPPLPRPVGPHDRHPRAAPPAPDPGKEHP